MITDVYMMNMNEALSGAFVLARCGSRSYFGKCQMFLNGEIMLKDAIQIIEKCHLSTNEIKIAITNIFQDGLSDYVKISKKIDLIFLRYTEILLTEKSSNFIKDLNKLGVVYE